MAASAKPAQPESPPAGRPATLAVLIGGALVIASTPVLFRLSQTGAAAAGFWRLVFALPPRGAPAIRMRVGARAAGFPFLLVFVGAMFAGDLACWHCSIQFTTIANSTVLANLSPVIVTLGAWLLWRERPSGAFLLGMAAAIAGATLMALATVGVGPGHRGSLGDGLAAATAVWYGLYFLGVRKARRAHGAATVMAWTSLVGAPILILTAVLLRERLTPPTWAGWAALVGLGAAQAAGQGAIAGSLGRLPAATAAVVVLVQPVAAALLAWIIVAEPMSLPQAAAGVMALAGIAFATLRGGQARAGEIDRRGVESGSATSDS